MPTDMCGQTRPWTPEEDQQHQIPQIKITLSPLSVGRPYNVEYNSPCPYESYQVAARLASTKITHGKSSELFSGDRDMHGHLEISGPNHPKGGVQYRNQGPINVQRRPTLDEPENIKFMNKNAQIYSVPGLKTKTFYKKCYQKPQTQKVAKSPSYPLRPHFNVGKPFGGTDNALTNVVLYLSR